MNDAARELPVSGPGPPALHRRRRRIVRVAAVTLSVFLVLIMLMLALENSLLYFPAVYPSGDWNPTGLEFEDADFTAPDGTKLHGWYVPHPDPRGVVLVAHGNGGNLSHRWELLKTLHALGVTAMIFDYRGYGRSTGSPSEGGILADARAARQWLAKRAGVRESDIVLFGESLGGGVMVDLAAEDGARALVLDGTFTSVPEVAAYHYPWLPVRMLMRTQLNSAVKIGRYRGPVLQFHGDADTIIPLAIGEKLFDAAGDPKQLVVLRGHDHNDPRPQELVDALDQFLAKLPESAAPVK